MFLSEVFMIPIVTVSTIYISCNYYKDYFQLFHKYIFTSNIIFIHLPSQPLSTANQGNPTNPTNNQLVANEKNEQPTSKTSKKQTLEKLAKLDEL